MGVTSATAGNIVAQLTEAGSSEIWVTDGSPADPSWEHSLDQAARLARVEGVDTAVPVRSFTNVSNAVTRLRGVGQAYSGKYLVTDERYLDLLGLTAASASIELLSISWQAPLVVMGSAAAEALGVSQVGPGVQIWVNGRSVDVAAVLEPDGDSLIDGGLYFSAPTMSYFSDQLDNYILVHCEPGYAEPLAKAIPSVLSPANPGQITVTVVAQLAGLQQGINSDLARLLSIIGGVILALSALTAGTTMFLSVQHRGPEIALRRAMGTSRGAIWRRYTYEGVAIGCSGGILGTAVGLGVTAIITRLHGWPLSIGVGIPLLGLAVGFCAGAVASIIPAVAAARQDPAGILRFV